MGSELVSDSSAPTGSGKPTPLTYTDVFYAHLPYYLSIGMTWDEYWLDDCMKVKYYREAWNLKRKQKNTELWLQGMYIYEAIADLVPVLRFTFDKHPPKAQDYPKEPYPLDKWEREAQQKRKEEAKAKSLKDKMQRWMMKNNNLMNKKSGDG